MAKRKKESRRKWVVKSAQEVELVLGSQESNILTTCDVGEGIVLWWLVLYGKNNSSKTTCREIKNFLLEGSKHLYHLCISLYPTKTQIIVFGSNLLRCVSQV